MVEVEQAVAVEERGRGGRAEEELEVRRGRRRSCRLRGGPTDGWAWRAVARHRLCR